MSTLYTIESPQGPPSLSEVASRLQLTLSALDASFGVVLIDPKRHLYAVRANSGDANSPASADPGVSGPFADPKIEPFGPPRSR